jgi:endonuclease/exonuclease/phosphatase family metal-dependent hydrolase
MTWNVHHCVGIDRKHSPERIADVIRALEPDVVALQEVETDHPRSDRIHQPRHIADLVDMDVIYHPARLRSGAGFGNATLTRHTIRARQGGLLPRHPVLRLQTRGALWATVRIGHDDIQLINTHLGLLGRERLRQASALCGGDWLGHPDCATTPRIVCGDFNATPACASYRHFAGHLRDAQEDDPRSTWPSPLPFRRLDHVFVCDNLSVRNVEVPRNALTKVASDHLPVVVDLEVKTSS